MEYKGYNIKGDGTYGQKAIHSIGSGALPKALQGAFTTDPQARRAIDVYMSSLERSKDMDSMSASFGMTSQAAPAPLGE